MHPIVYSSYLTDASVDTISHMRPSEANSIAKSLIAARGFIRLREAQAAGVHAETLRRMVAAGEVIRVARGLYAPASFDRTEHTDLAVAAAKVPGGVICLLSALWFHGIGTQLPHEVWMMIDRRDHKPRLDHPPMRFIRGSGPCLSDGVVEHRVDGEIIRVFDPAKTIVDCFRYRRHVGLEVALEAMRESLRDKRCTASQIGDHAIRCGISTVIRPYLEALA